MELSFSNLMVRKCKNKEDNLFMDSILSFGESFKYSLISYIVLKRFLTTQFDCVFTINSIFEYISRFYDNGSSTDKKIDKYKRQKQYFKLFLKKILYTEIFYLEELNYDADNKIQVIEDAVDKISNTNELIVLSLNPKKEQSYGFTFISEEEIKKILQYNTTDVDVVKLFNLYCDISSRVFIPKDSDQRIEQEQYKYSYPAFENFITDGVLTKKDTIKKYLDILVDLDLIRYQGVGEMYKGDEVRNGSYHYILTKDYPGYSVESYNELFKCILAGYKKAKKSEGWKIVGSGKKSKKDKDLFSEFIEKDSDNQCDVDAEEREAAEQWSRNNYEQTPDDVKEQYWEKDKGLVNLNNLVDGIHRAS